MPNTALQTKATLTTYPGCRGDQCPYWIPTCAKNNLDRFHYIVYLSQKMATIAIISFIVMFIFSVNCQDLGTCERLCVWVGVYFVLLRMFAHQSFLLCFVPWGWKDCLSLNLPLFISAEAICANFLYKDLAKTTSSTWTVYAISHVQKEHH